MVAHTRQILHPPAAHQHNAVLLQVVALIGNVGDDLLTIGQAHLGHFPHGGVRFLGCTGIHLQTYPLAEGTILQSRRRAFLLNLLPPFADQLVNGWHFILNTLQKSALPRCFWQTGAGYYQRLSPVQQVLLLFLQKVSHHTLLCFRLGRD